MEHCQNYRIIHGDALEAVRAMPGASVDCVLTDPPYFRKLTESWDRQWANRGDFLAWLGLHLNEWRRVLKPNGSLYVFASPELAAHVEVLVDARFDVLSSVVWHKPNASLGRTRKESLRRFAPTSERIIFAEQQGSDRWASGEAEWERKCDELRGFVFEPLRAYLDDERRRAGIGKADCNAACGFKRIAGGMASRHYFSRSQWALPTAEHYAALQLLFQAAEPSALRREYEDLRREYEDLRRPFSLTNQVQWGDVWTFNGTPPSPMSGPRRHPCEKPQPLISHMLEASTRPGALILDPFTGSGAIGEAALRLGRRYIGVELDETWADRASARLDSVVAKLAGQIGEAA